MKKYALVILFISLIFNGCRKDYYWPTAQERLDYGARRIFICTVMKAVEAVQFCELFQEYNDASGDEKILDKYKEIRKNVTKEGNNTYNISYYGSLSGKFTTSDIAVNVKGGAIVFEDIGLTVSCVDDGDWEIKVSDGQYNWSDKINFTATYKKSEDSGHTADITIDGTLISESRDTDGYKAEFYSDGDIHHIGGNIYSGIFKMTTFDDKGSKLDEYALRLGNMSETLTTPVDDSRCW